MSVSKRRTETTPRKRTSRILAALGIVAATLAFSVTMTATPAHATATKCVEAHSRPSLDSTCLYVRGTSLWVERTAVWHRDFMAAICNYKASNVGIVENGSRLTMTSALVSGCTAVDASPRVSFTVMETFQHNSNYCGQFYHSGAWVPGTPCVKITR